MKIQNMSVIFIIVIIPIMLVVSYYIGLQINTITMQNAYDQKLLTATKDAIDAFEINTTEWNSEYSLVSDSKRRDVLASVNAFTQSLANSLGMSGATSQEILNYVPAVGYTLYDGFYIYCCREMNQTKETENGLTKLKDDGSVETTGNTIIKNTLNPYTAYTTRYTNNVKKIDIIVNYTMDNYMKIYGKTKNNFSLTKQGFLSVTDNAKGIQIDSEENNITIKEDQTTFEEYKIDKIKFKEQIIKPEQLTEQICLQDGTKKIYNYIYDKDNEKLYYDSTLGEFFRLNDDGETKYLEKDIVDGNYTQYTYKKICIPVKNNNIDKDEWEVLKIYQGLNGDRKGKLYRAYVENSMKEGDTGYGFETSKVIEIIDNEEKKKYFDGISNYDNLILDYSAINYCVNSYVFSKWVENNLKEHINVEVEGKQEKIFDINVNNNPDPESEEYGESVLTKHKREVMKEKIISALQQSIELVEGQGLNYEYRLPELTEEDWQQTLSNVSIIAFMQGMPIGLKYYNNYQIATSTTNKEFVNPRELYFSGMKDSYYHREYCASATGDEDSYIGYRSVEYKVKSRNLTQGTDPGKTKYYYLHDNTTNSEMECYDCIVNRSSYIPSDTSLITKEKYYEALARERNMQKETVVLAEIIRFIPIKEITNIEVGDRTSVNGEDGKKGNGNIVYNGNYIEYTIHITNESTVANTLTITDKFNVKLDKFCDINTIEITGDPDTIISKIDVGNDNEDKGYIKFEVTGIKPRDTEYDFKIKMKIIGNVGKYIDQAEVTYGTYKETSNQVETYINNDVNIMSNPKMGASNIVFVLDSSSSMLGRSDGIVKYKAVNNAIKEFVNKMSVAGVDSSIGAVRFATLPILPLSITWNPHWKDTTSLKTHYYYVNDNSKNNWGKFLEWINPDDGQSQGTYKGIDLEEIRKWIESGPPAIAGGWTSYDAGLSYPDRIINWDFFKGAGLINSELKKELEGKGILSGVTIFIAKAFNSPFEEFCRTIIKSAGAIQILDDMKKEFPNRKNVVIFLSDGMPTLGSYNYKTKAQIIKNSGTTFISVSYANSSNWSIGALQDMASSAYWYFDGDNANIIFERIYEQLSGNIIETTIVDNWSNPISLTGIGEDTLNAQNGDCWIKLKNEKFKLCVENNKIYMYSENNNKKVLNPEETKIIINGVEDTLKEWGNRNNTNWAIGMFDDYLYINLSKFKSDVPVSIEIEAEEAE